MNISKLLAFRTLYPAIEDLKMPLRTAYKLNKLMKKAEEGYDFYSKEFARIANEYGEKDGDNFVFTDDKTSIKIIPGKETECNEKIAALNNFEMDAPGVTFTLDELENFDLTLAQLDILMPLIEE